VIRDRDFAAGLFADITIFDPSRVKDRSIYEDPFNTTKASYVIVNGQLVRHGNAHWCSPRACLAACPVSEREISSRVKAAYGDYATRVRLQCHHPLAIRRANRYYYAAL
jgi:hypothetical protein